VGKYLVYRLYTEEGLSLQRMKPAGRRKAARPRAEKFRATAPAQAWSMDFGADQLQDRSRFRALTIVDVYTREALAIEPGQSLKGDDVVRTLNRVKLERGVPKVLYCDNGSEFTSQAMDLWAYRNEVQIDFSRPGKPTDVSNGMYTPVKRHRVCQSGRCDTNHYKQRSVQDEGYGDWA
jgi:putative transposase